MAESPKTDRTVLTLCRASPLACVRSIFQRRELLLFFLVDSARSIQFLPVAARQAEADCKSERQH